MCKALLALHCVGGEAGSRFSASLLQSLSKQRCCALLAGEVTANPHPRSTTLLSPVQPFCQHAPNLSRCFVSWLEGTNYNMEESPLCTRSRSTSLPSTHRCVSLQLRSRWLCHCCLSILHECKSPWLTTPVCCFLCY